MAIALDRKNFTIENLVARNAKDAGKIVESLTSKPEILSPESFSDISSEVIFICTQDSEIESVAESLAENLSNKPVVFHTSGSFSSEVLRALKNAGCRTGSIHPLVSISDSQLGAARFANAYFCVEGDAEAVETAEEIIGKLSGKSFSIATEYKTLYHASAVTACGHLVALVDAAIEMLARCGLAETDARRILLPLIESTVENLKTQTAAAALTGTFARADAGTLDRHLKILGETVSAEALEIYLLLGMRSLSLAETQGANRENLDEMRGQILLAKKNLK